MSSSSVGVAATSWAGQHDRRDADEPVDLGAQLGEAGGVEGYCLEF